MSSRPLISVVDCLSASTEAFNPEQLRMTDEILENYIRQLLDTNLSEINAVWQGAEPTLMGLDFFKRSIEYVAKYRRPGQDIRYTIHTNGTLLNDEWCVFFKKHNFLIGLSVDGPKVLHDAYRVDKAGAGCFDQVIPQWELLRRHEVDLKILCAIHAINADHPLEVYRFLRDTLQAEYIQFVPIVERTTGQFLPFANLAWGEKKHADRSLNTRSGRLVTERSVGAEQFGRFLIAIFNEWVRCDVGKVFVQTFGVALESWLEQYNQVRLLTNLRQRRRNGTQRRPVFL